MNEELNTFLLECGCSEITARTTSLVLTAICTETHNYNRLVGILNETRLANQEPEQDEQSGNSA